MPPTTVPISCPRGMGPDVVPFLESHGLVARVPILRASPFEGALAHPFEFYLTQRLGIRPRLSWSKALSRGSWFHKFLELDTFVGPAPQFSEDPALLLAARLDEVRAICAATGIFGDHRADIIAQEERDFHFSLTVYRASSQIHIAPEVGTWRSYLQKPFWKILARELPLTLEETPERPATRVTLDMLLYHTGHNRLWIVDAKTTGVLPSLRAVTIPNEFQPQHYFAVVRDSLPLLIDTFGLPQDVQLQGMLHPIIQKPVIEFNQRDRNFTLDTSPFKSGPRKGQPRNEKNYYGEPVIENYYGRVRDWYLGAGDYLDEAPERAAHPPCNISFVDASLDLERTSQYTSRLQYLSELCRREAYPGNFLSGARGLTTKSGKLTWVGHFALTPVREWPDLMHKLDLMVGFRDEEPTDGPPQQEEDCSQED